MPAATVNSSSRRGASRPIWMPLPPRSPARSPDLHGGNMTDLVLETDPDFARRRSPALTGVFVTLAVIAAVALVLCLVNYGSLAGDGTVSWRGRSTTALPGIIAPTLV